MFANNSLFKQRWLKLRGGLLFIFLVLITILAPASFNAQEKLNIDRELLALAVEQPETAVRVIVQNNDTVDHIKEVATHLGGRVVQDLGFIHAVALELPAKAVIDLATLVSVNWISIDRPFMSEQVNLTKSLRDEFTSESYSNNNGIESWHTEWMEINDDNNPSYGDIEITRGELMLKDDNRAIYRSANLTDAQTAVLSFNYRRYSLDNSNDYIALLLSTDNGNSWTELNRLAGPANDSSSQTASYDISPYLPNTVTIKFVTSAAMSDYDRLYIDNVQIEFEPSEATNDPPPTGTTLTPQIVLDEFNQITWENNDGTMNWSVPWTGADSSGSGAADGYVYVKNGRFTFHYIYANTEYAVRSADLSGSAQATLSFDWQTQGLDSGETISLLISQDGEQFTELAAYGGSKSGSSNFDISHYISPATTVRIENRSSNWEFGEYAYFDNIKIESAPPEPTLNHYLNTTNVQSAWDMGLQGQNIAVAVIDSGISANKDFGDRLIAQASFNADAASPNDSNGHGTHIAGIIGGNGANSAGLYQGIAPQVNLIGLKVSDETGMAYESDTVAAMQWVLENKDTYNIRVVNLSLNSTEQQSYHTSPLDLASELLWFNGVVVVASAGNRSLDGNFYTITASPANDPFIITVGASVEQNNDDPADDDIALFSAHGTTVNGFVKPDIIAPGYNIVSVLSGDSNWDTQYPERLEGNNNYFRLSGTSMAAPIVSGAAALLLQNEPDLTPDQVKYRLMNTGSTIAPLWFDAIFDQTIYPYLDVAAIINSTSTESANQGVMPHMALAQMALIAYWANQNGAETIDWENVDWSTVNWDSVNWEVVDWTSVNWGSVNWGSVNWGSVNWGSVNWGSVNWGSVNWGSVNWGSVNWGSVNWGSVNWGSVFWEG